MFARDIKIYFIYILLASIASSAATSGISCSFSQIFCHIHGGIAAISRGITPWGMDSSRNIDHGLFGSAISLLILSIISILLVSIGLIRLTTAKKGSRLVELGVSKTSSAPFTSMTMLVGRTSIPWTNTASILPIFVIYSVSLQAEPGITFDGADISIADRASLIDDLPIVIASSSASASPLTGMI